jgi:enhancer of polycomb-like protein
MTLFSEKDHAHLLKDPALTVVNAEGRPQIVFPYRLGAFQPQLPRRDAQTVVRQGQSPMNGAPVAHQLSAVSLNGTPVSKTMAPPVLRISSNGGMRPPATNLQSNGNTPHGAPPQPIPIPVSQHSPASRAAIAMPYVDAQKPEVVTPTITNSAMPTSQPDANAELTLNGSPVRPKTQNLTPQHGGLSVPTNGFHLTPMTNLTTPTINSAFGQNQPHTGGLSLQQMQNLKTAFANIPAPDLAALQNVGRAISASYMNLAVNGANMNMQLPTATNMKMSPQMQRAMNSATFQKPTLGVNGNGADGQLNGGGTITASSILGNSTSSSATNDARTPPRNGVHVNGQRSLTPHAQPTSSPLLSNTQAQRSPRPSTAGMPSSSLQQQQQAVKTIQNSF